MLPSIRGSVPPRELVGEVLGQEVMVSGVLAVDRLADDSRRTWMSLPEGDGDLVGGDEGPPEVVPVIGNRH